MSIMIRLILFSLVLTAVNSQLAYIWLNYHHFQCAQNTRNYRESIRHQYLCTSSQIRTCIYDDNVYTGSSDISLNYFCGFIDGRNALQPHTIWHIHLKPNIKIDFLKFMLSHYFLCCDHEFLRISSNNKSSTFCGNRFPWVYDASDTRLDIMLVTHYSSRENYQVELLYYVAYVPENQHFVIFIHQSDIINTHISNTEQNAFESFHFVSSSRLNILQLEAMNICSKEQVICYDGPGIKSPILEFTHNQSEPECLSSTFQMVCTFSRANGCNKIPYLRYHSMRARDIIEQVIKPGSYLPLAINASDHGIGTTKYIYDHRRESVGATLILEQVVFAFPYMLYEGSSCMYGGMYIVKTLESKDFELVSLCTPNSQQYYIEINELTNTFLVIIHYSEYSFKRLQYIVDILCYYWDDTGSASDNRVELTFINQKYHSEDTISITLPTHHRPAVYYMKSYLLKLRKVHYINISLSNEGTLLYTKFTAIHRTECISVTIFYSPFHSNIRGRQYDQETRYWNETFRKYRLIKSVFLNMNGCDFWSVPVWGLSIDKGYKSPKSALSDGLLNTSSEYVLNISEYVSIPIVKANIDLTIHNFPQHQFWVMIHFVRLEETPFVIYRVTIQVDNIVSRASIEVPDGHYESSSVYGWNHFQSPGYVYITVNKVLNMLFESNNSNTKVHTEVRNVLRIILSVEFMRHFIFGERKQQNLSGQASGEYDFSFHNHR